MKIRSLEEGDFEGWRRLFRGYVEFYGRTADVKTTAKVWGWLMEGSHGLEGLCAQDGEELVGLAHFHLMPHTVTGGSVMYLSDLYVKSGVRNAGVGRILMGAVSKRAKEVGALRVRLLTERYNFRGRRLYDGYGGTGASDFLLYDFPF